MTDPTADIDRNPCSQCGGNLDRLGTCCYRDLCGDCEDRNTATNAKAGGS